MRILVISDSQRRGSTVEKIILAHPEARDVFFLGDETPDIEDFTYVYPDRRFYIVSGNCDYNSFFPTCLTADLQNTKILYTHGHTLGVKYSLTRLLAAAKQNECKIALYGHTHVAKVSYEDGIYLVNPGSCSRAREGKNSYAVIDIEKNGIMPIIIEL